MNHDILRQRYSHYRWQMRTKKTKEEKAVVKKEMSDFLKAIAQCFGQETVALLTAKKHVYYGAATNVQQRHYRE